MCDVVCLQMAHLMARRLEPTLYCSTMIAMHSLQKQWPHVSTAHWRREGDGVMATKGDTTGGGKYMAVKGSAVQVAHSVQSQTFTYT